MLARDMDATYAVGEKAFLSGSAQRTRLLGQLYTSLLPAVEARLLLLEQLHTGDAPAEQADIAQLAEQWTAYRDLCCFAASGVFAWPWRQARNRRSSLTRCRSRTTRRRRISFSGTISSGYFFRPPWWS